MSLRPRSRFASLLVLCTFFCTILLLYVFTESFASPFPPSSPPPWIKTEGFGGGRQHLPAYQATTWSPQVLDAFVELQQTLHPEVIFDMETIQKQASQEDAEYFLKHKRWYWPPSTVQLYTTFIQHQTQVRLDPVSTRLHRDQQLYTNQAILLLMASDSKEGRFLIDGVQLPSPAATAAAAAAAAAGGEGTETEDANSNTVDPYPHNKDVRTLKCVSTSSSPDSSSQLAILTTNGSTKNPSPKIIDSYSIVPFLVPGFSFVNPDDPCNPCMNLDNPYGDGESARCAFRVDVGQGDGASVSEVWKLLWGMGLTDEEEQATEHYVFDKWMVRVKEETEPENENANTNTNDETTTDNISYELGDKLGISVMFQESVPRLPQYAQFTDNPLEKSSRSSARKMKETSNVKPSMSSSIATSLQQNYL